MPLVVYVASVTGSQAIRKQQEKISLILTGKKIEVIRTRLAPPSATQPLLAGHLLRLNPRDARPSLLPPSLLQASGASLTRSRRAARGD